jgi:hypothetical protein
LSEYPVSCINFIEPLLYFLVISGSANSREKDNNNRVGIVTNAYTAALLRVTNDG